MGAEPFKLAFYRTHRGDCPATDFINSLRERAQAKVARWLGQLREHGPNLHRPMADVLRGPIRELRVQFGRENYRFLFFIQGGMIVITHGFRKTTGPIDHREIERAENYRQIWLARGEEQ